MRPKITVTVRETRDRLFERTDLYCLNCGKQTLWRDVEQERLYGCTTCHETHVLGVTDEYVDTHAIAALAP